MVVEENLSTRDMSNVSKVFHNKDVRELIFEFKRCERWGELMEARGLVIARNKKRKRPLQYQELQLHQTNPFNWRETAVLLGQYWAFG